MSFIQSIPWWVYPIVLLVAIAIWDLIQKKHAIRNNFPLVGHFRYMLESIGPELRQYIVANNREELPFNRSQRSWIYASAKKENNYEGFGTDQDIHEPGYIFIKPALFPFKVTESHPHHENPHYCPSAKTVGLQRQRPYRPQSVINISAMSYGSLSSAAIEALNKGAKKINCYHNTGEGGLSPYHKNGADVVFHIGTGYFGVRGDDGNFSMDKMVELTTENPFIRMIEVKLSQGAKPGKGGVLPGKKITQEISDIRGVPMGEDVISPAAHSAFSNVVEMVDFIEEIAEKTGLPVGIKAAIGQLETWEELAALMQKTGKGPDFISVDGGEGGTGAAPRAFADHVALPWVYGFSSIYKLFLRYELTEKTTFIGSGRLGLPDSAVMALAMGADLINIAREAMLSIGCIQAQICHTNRCPVGIATNNKWYVSGLDPALKSERFYNYIKAFSKEINEITHACGYEHPSQIRMEDIDVSMGDNNRTISLKEIYGYEKNHAAFAGFLQETT